MKQFTDQSTATRMEKAKRVLRSLANGHDYRYFHGDGYPRHNDLQQDAAAALEVLEQLTKPVTRESQPIPRLEARQDSGRPRIRPA